MIGIEDSNDQKYNNILTKLRDLQNEEIDFIILSIRFKNVSHPLSKLERILYYATQLHDIQMIELSEMKHHLCTPEVMQSCLENVITLNVCI